ncbi:MAG: hypothetical protein B7Z23_13980, partial [Pseudomonadales bacterium 32-61-5]
MQPFEFVLALLQGVMSSLLMGQGGVDLRQQARQLGLAQETVQPVQFIHEDLNRDDDLPAVCRKIFHS